MGEKFVMTWHYKPLEYQGEWGVSEQYEFGDGVEAWTDPIRPMADSPEELLRVLIMMVYDISKYALKDKDDE